MSTAYLLVSGAVTAYRVPALVASLRSNVHVEQLLIVPTPNARQVISPLDLSRIAGAGVIESYLDARLQPRAPFAPLLFAPCSFNSLNKLALGIADSLPLSLAAEMIGARQPVMVAVSTNVALWAHPRAQESMRTLRQWGVQVIEPRMDARKQELTLAPVDEIAASFVQHAVQQ
jgi:phosphopantothenoylcysteine synthetase/decarboxylase